MNSRQSITPVGIVAHRGYAAAYPENTLPAIKAAVDAGVVAVEVDIQFSRDGVPLLLHDADIGCIASTNNKGTSDVYAIPLAYSLIHNQGGALKACLGLVKSDNAECESDCKPRRARPEAHTYGIVLLIKYFGHSLRSTLCSCTLQVSQGHGIIDQRFLKYLRQTLRI